jgi:hypothetical protein
MMNIQEIFLKPVDRHIDGVIKADDNRSLLTEIEEYVITDEVRKALDKFLNQYLDSKVVNGVWISGFFGSGKSHLLKMLALLLENRVVEGHHALDLFLPKTNTDAIFKSNLDKACKIPSKSILFNIAQKANIVNKDHSDALLSTFIKVFDEMCGYFGKQGYIAQFERDLDNNGSYEAFKEAYKTIAKKDWLTGRERPLFESGNISKAYAQTTGASEQEASKILEKYRTHHQMSIEDFANLVNQYIEKQDKNFRLNFFVDEVGQYIANNVRLMTDLQTIAESLATRCKGRAWIIVTAQQDMDSILGEMTKQAGNDFSKIQGRFKCKVNLSSANVDEVIRLRLLAKNNKGKDMLDSLYGVQQNNLKTLFDLPDGAKKYRNFKDREHFVSSYPFIPYQFTLFQSAIQNLSKHDAFTGQYQSVGERSMLEVFQDVVKRIATQDVGKLATFNLMFEGVREVIKSQVLWGVTQSEQQMDDEFTKKVLKVLFLVKYVKEFQSTPRNLTVLLIERFDQDLVALRKQVDQALSTLEQQTYIKRNEDIYEYLTDKERDIEEDIKQTDVDPQAINEQISNVFFTSALGMSKIKYERNGQDFPFTKRLDNQSFGKEYELGIHIITESQAKESLRAMSLQRDDLVVLIPDDDRFYKDNRLYLQTETYVRQNSANGRTPEEIAIVTDKSHQNQARFEQIKRQAAELLGNAQMFVAGDDVPTQVSDRKVRISNGFQKLIEKVYPNLEMLGEARYDEKDIPKHLKAGKDALGDLLIQMSAPESEILSFIARNKVDGIRTTFSSLLNTFEKKPNGWSYASILCMVARLYGLAKIEVSLDNKLLDESSFERAIRNGTYHSRIIVQPVLEISATKIKRMKTVYADAFHKPVSTNEAKSLATEFSKAVEQKYFELQRYMERIDRFPFLEQLKPAVDLLRRLQNKTYDWYYSNLDEFEVELPDTIDHVVDPILSFMNGSQKAIYEDARKFLIDQQYNLPYVGGEEIERLKDILADKNCFRGNHMITAKELVGILSDKVERKLTELRQEKEQQLESYKRKLENIEGYAQLSQDRIDSVERELTSIQKQIQSITQISMINDRFSRFERSEYPQLASNIKDWAAVKEEPPRYIPEHPEDPPKVREEPPKKKMPITISNLRPRYRKTFLESQTDVEEYVQAFKAALLAELEKGNSLLVN